MNIPYRTFVKSEAERVEEHAYSPHCNCDECFEAWLAMPEPTAAEREQMARDFMRAVAPSSGGELLTDWPKVSFPDLDRLTDAQLLELSKVQNRHARDRRGRGERRLRDQRIRSAPA